MTVWVTVTWVRNDDGTTTCDAHNETFRAGLKTCAGCDKNPGAPITAPIAIDAAEKEQRIMAGEYRMEGKYLRRIARGWVDGTPMEQPLGLKAYAEAAKYERLANEVLKEIRDKEHDRWLANEAARLKGVGVGS